MIIKDYNELSEIREKYKKENILFASGTFDLAHAGHVLFFEDCKKYGDILFVAIGSDAICKKYKGDERPIMNEHIRLKIVDSFKPVDYTMFVREADFTPSFPISIAAFPKLFTYLKPDKWIINKDARDINIRHELANKFNIELIVLERTCPKEFENISTTTLIERIRNMKI